MEDKGKPEPIAMKDMFPGVKAERVELLLQDSDFQARQALFTLYLEMERKQKAGVDVTDLSLQLSKAYTPAMRALGDKLTKAGWNSAEQSAAQMTAEGTIRIR